MSFFSLTVVDLANSTHPMKNPFEPSERAVSSFSNKICFELYLGSSVKGENTISLLNLYLFKKIAKIK